MGAKGRTVSLAKKIRYEPPGECPIVFINKRRAQPGEIEKEKTVVIGEVENKVCIINDDIIDTAGTIENAASTLWKRGAEKVMVVATHGLFSQDQKTNEWAIERIKKAKINKVIITDSVFLSKKKKDELGDLLLIVSIAPLFTETIYRIHNNESVSTLF